MKNQEEKAVKSIDKKAPNLVSVKMKKIDNCCKKNMNKIVNNKKPFYPIGNWKRKSIVEK